jgi:hypothetical protein
MKPIIRSSRIGAAAAVAALLATLVPSVALAYTGTGTSYPLIVVDNGPGSQSDPHVSGTFAVYTDDAASQIEYFDLSTNTTTPIARPSTAIDALPDVSLGSIVFTRLSSAGQPIFLYPLGAGFSIEVSPAAISLRRNPAVGGPTIVWEDAGISATGDPELAIATDVFGLTPPFQLTNDAAADRNPSVSPTGTTIVWEKGAFPRDVYAAKGFGASWVTTPVATSSADEIRPDTNGKEIVYESNAGGGRHVYVTTLGGSPAQLSVPGSVEAVTPAISGNFVAFASSDGVQTDIYVYDLATNAVRRITDTPEIEVLPDITTIVSGAITTVTVVWQVFEAGSSFNVYASRFQLGAPAALTLSPAADTNPVGTSHTVTATVVDGAGQAVPNVVVRFSVSGSVTTSGQCTSGAGGQCSFSYLGPQLPGADLISAFADTDGDGVWDQCLVALGCVDEPAASATKAWVLPTSTAGEASGGGQIQNSAGDKISFGFHAKSAGGLQGGCNVVDHGGRMIKCLDVLSLTIAGNDAAIYGNATDNGAATTYVIHAVDNADPGKGADTFSIQTASGYSASGTLTAGNVQVQP